MTDRQDLELGFIRRSNGSPAESQNPVENNTNDKRESPYRRSHRDAYARELSADSKHPHIRKLLNDDPAPEAFIDPSDGRLQLLQVQCQSPDKCRGDWSIVCINSASRPVLLALVDFLYENPATVSWLYVPMAFTMAICLLFLAKMESDQDRQTYYEPVLHRNWTFPQMVHDNNRSATCEPEFSEGQARPIDYYQEHRLLKRRAMPPFLCFRDGIDLDNFRPGGDVSKPVSETNFKDYVFVSYTRAHFRTEDPDPAISHKHRMELLRIGIKAAEDANVNAFWLDCFPPNVKNEENEDVYRICDFVRMAHSVVLAIDSSVSSGSLKSALHEWGKRLWTLPELVLSSSHRKMAVYDRNGKTPFSHHKRTLGWLAWEDDWQIASQLVDHYESTVHLTQLELTSIANRCMRRRTTSLKRKPGDYAYALMGLLRRRPQIVPTDSDFVAFARLSLSNTSDSIIERLLCMQPPSRDTPWHTLVDAYGAQLNDIAPSCQIADVDSQCNSETIVLDGIFGASICWSKLEPIPFLKRPTFVRRLTKTLLPKAPFILAVALFLLVSFATSTSKNDLIIFKVVAGVVAALFFAVVLAGPALLKNLYYGKFWSTQARLFGIKGLADLKQVERDLFGLSVNQSNEGRLKWSTDGSLQSVGTMESDSKYFEGKPPELLLQRDHEGKHLFTLIDTYTLEATPFYADRPPTVALICGRAQGMQRAVLCSYNWTTQTFSREVVLRMKTIVLNRMFRVDQCRVSFRR